MFPFLRPQGGDGAREEGGDDVPVRRDGQWRGLAPAEPPHHPGRDDPEAGQHDLSPAASTTY